ncbi:ABC transporter permease [Phycicoccus sonneratiae]|uniref:ABC-2 type transport system permease protein n=1 Tax=Phycicoccus sonneratiae TaxID=2807628 RepID=A0ABS2CLE6_9MICO|nr:hypothetical protein [Phycicoccus sonneraticus]MBM6400288.1 hypothetical protein [Phycicoccus sonneraticus]
MTGLGAVVRVRLRTRWRVALVWVVAVVGSLVGTAVSVAGLYDTPEKLRSYADAVAGDALVAVNGRVEGIGTLGGVVQDEFGFVAALALPLLGVSLVAAMTRREEESGRLEALLAGRVDRRAPVAASLVVVSAAVVLVVLGSAGGMALAGIPPARATLHAASLGALALVFACLASLLAQLVLHARTVSAISLGVLAASYVVRGVGDVRGWWLAWLSPLTWVERAAPFGRPRWWVLAVPLLVSAALAGAAVLVAGRRDLGAALVRGGAGPARASRLLRHPVGLALALHRSSFVGWLAGAVALAAVMGALASDVVAAVRGNPGVERLLAPGDRPADGFLSVVLLYLAVLATGYVVQSLGALRREETDGRLEPQLVGTVGRLRWLGVHVGVVTAGLVVLLGGSSLVLALATAWSTGDAGGVRPIVVGGLAYVPAVLVVGGVAVALLGLLPRAVPAAWAVVGVVAVVALLGPGLRMPGWLLDLSPTMHVGDPPVGAVAVGGVVGLTLVAAGLVAAGMAGFRRRTVPSG